MQTQDVESSHGTQGVPGRELLIQAEQIRTQYRNMPGAFIGSALYHGFLPMVTIVVSSIGGSALSLARPSSWTTCQLA